MSKVVTFQSAEYYELINLGWVVVQQMGGNAVMMIQDGTTCVDPRGRPETKVDTSAWKPYWLGRATPGVIDPIPVNPFWIERSRTVLPLDITGPKTIILFQSSANPTFLGQVAIRQGEFGSIVYFKVWVPYSDAVNDYHARGGIGP